MDANNVDKCIEKLLKFEMLSEAQIKFLCNSLKQNLLNEGNVISINTPVTVVGDLHGQFHDLIELFQIGGSCPDTNYLFLGNYVDRGGMSVETISLLICFKLRWPNRVTLLRGNHESRPVSKAYGFYAECLKKYGNVNVWKEFNLLFDHFSIAAVIDNKIFCVHAGLSPSIETIDQIRILNRFKDIPTQGPMCDLVNSDPDSERESFTASPRGGFLFGEDVVQKFLSLNNVEHIIRSNQLCMDGYQIMFSNSLSTVWSAPNFLYRCGNVAAIVEITENLHKRYNTFGASPDSSKLRDQVTSNLKYDPDYFM